MNNPFFKLAFLGLTLTVLIIGSNARADDNCLPPQVVNLINQFETMRADVTTLKSQNAALQNQVKDLQARLTKANNVLALAPFVHVDLAQENGVRAPNIVFSGANVHIVSGSGTTWDNNNRLGLGNLIIGYNEDPPQLTAGYRGGSHNLIIGIWHQFTRAAWGGLVAGAQNTISAEGASITGGDANTASGIWSSITGGFENTASGNQSSISGGQNNTASAENSSVSGGFNNNASGAIASVSGGAANIASGYIASVTGGQGNRASGEQASSVTGGFENTANGLFAAILGGENNTAGGSRAVVLGGQNVTNNKDYSIAPQPPFP